MQLRRTATLTMGRAVCRPPFGLSGYTGQYIFACPLAINQQAGWWLLVVLRSWSASLKQWDSTAACEASWWKFRKIPTSSSVGCLIGKAIHQTDI